MRLRLIPMVVAVVLLAVASAHGEAQGQPGEHFWKTMDLVKELELRPREADPPRDLEDSQVDQKLQHALAPELRNLPLIDNSDEAAEKTHFKMEDLSPEVRGALARNDVRFLKSLLQSDSLVRRWEAVFALGLVKYHHEQARVALQEYISSNSGKLFTDFGNDAFLRRVVDGEAHRSLEIVSKESHSQLVLWCAGSILACVAGWGLFGLRKKAGSKDDG